MSTTPPEFRADLLADDDTPREIHQVWAPSTGWQDVYDPRPLGGAEPQSIECPACKLVYPSTEPRCPGCDAGTDVRADAERIRAAVDAHPIAHLGDLALFLGGSIDSFIGQLLQLMCKADMFNRRKLASAYPREDAALTAWHVHPRGSLTFGELRDLIPEVTP